MAESYLASIEDGPVAEHVADNAEHAARIHAYRFEFIQGKPGPVRVSVRSMAKDSAWSEFVVTLTPGGIVIATPDERPMTVERDCVVCSAEIREGFEGPLVERLVCFIYLLTRGIPGVEGMAWGSVKHLTREAAKGDGQNVYTSKAGEALAREIVEELLAGERPEG